MQNQPGSGRQILHIYTYENKEKPKATKKHEKGRGRDRQGRGANSNTKHYNMYENITMKSTYLHSNKTTIFGCQRQCFSIKPWLYWIHCVDWSALKLSDPPAVSSQLLGLKVYATTPGTNFLTLVSLKYWTRQTCCFRLVHGRLGSIQNIHLLTVVFSLSRLRQ